MRRKDEAIAALWREALTPLAGLGATSVKTELDPMNGGRTTVATAHSLLPRRLGKGHVKVTVADEADVGETELVGMLVEAARTQCPYLGKHLKGRSA